MSLYATFISIELIQVVLYLYNYKFDTKIFNSFAYTNLEGHSASEGTNSDEDEEKEIAKSKNVLNTSSSEEDQGILLTS